VPFGIRVLENLKKEPAIVELFQRLERESPGILDEMRRFAAAAAQFTRADGYNPWFEKIDAPYARLMTQRVIDCVHMIGTPDEICEKILELVQAGATTIATATTTATQRHQAGRRDGSSSSSPNQSISSSGTSGTGSRRWLTVRRYPRPPRAARAYPIPRRPCYTSDSRTAVQSVGSGWGGTPGVAASNVVEIDEDPRRGDEGH